MRRLGATGGDSSSFAAPRTVRLARHTSAFAEVVSFYGDGVGLPVVATFDDHDGYSGVIFGLPGSTHELEFTTSLTGEPGPVFTPSADDLLALYFESRAAVAAFVGGVLAWIGLIHAPQLGWGAAPGVALGYALFGVVCLVAGMQQKQAPG